MFICRFSCKQLGHPALFELRDMSMSLIVQAEKYNET